MAKSSVRKAIKHMLHEDGVTAADSTGVLHTQKVHSRIPPTKDVCINRENPNRKLPNSRALVAGFDPRGNFGGVIPHGFTHGYWTMNRSPFQQSAEDGAGNTYSGDYVSRILLEFDLDDAGLTVGDKVENATLSLYFYRSKSIQGGSEFMFDFHRFHPGLTANRGDITQASASITCDIVPGPDAIGDTLTITDAGGRAIVFEAAGANNDADHEFKVDGANQGTVLTNLFHRIINATHGFSGTNGITGFGADGTTEYLVDHGSNVKELKLVQFGPAGGPAGNVAIVNLSAILFAGSTGTVSGFAGGLTGGNSETFTENATWWESDFTGGATYDSSKTWIELPTGATGSFDVTNGATHGAHRWEEQGLGISGSTAEHLTNRDVSLYKDFSGGPVGSDQDEFADNIYGRGFTANSTTVKAKGRLLVDAQQAVEDALANYDNKLRVMIKLRDDDVLDGTTDRAYVTFYSSEAEASLNSIDYQAVNDAKFSPSLQVTYLR